MDVDDDDSDCSNATVAVHTADDDDDDFVDPTTTTTTNTTNTIAKGNGGMDDTIKRTRGRGPRSVDRRQQGAASSRGGKVAGGAECGQTVDLAGEKEGDGERRFAENR